MPQGGHIEGEIIEKWLTGYCEQGEHLRCASVQLGVDRSQADASGGAGNVILGFLR
jgi:hypothetical protein